MTKPFKEEKTYSERLENKNLRHVIFTPDNIDQRSVVKISISLSSLLEKSKAIQYLRLIKTQ